jgi:hypothetical protein
MVLTISNFLGGILADHIKRRTQISTSRRLLVPNIANTILQSGDLLSACYVSV